MGPSQPATSSAGIGRTRRSAMRRRTEGSRVASGVHSSVASVVLVDTVVLSRRVLFRLRSS